MKNNGIFYKSKLDFVTFRWKHNLLKWQRKCEVENWLKLDRRLHKQKIFYNELKKLSQIIYIKFQFKIKIIK